MQTLNFTSTHATQTAKSLQFNTWHSPTKRSISQAHAENTHHWHHSARKLEEHSPLPMQTLDFTSTHSTQTAESLQFNTWHSPTKRSISQAHAENTHHWQHSARKLEEHPPLPMQTLDFTSTHSTQTTKKLCVRRSLFSSAFLFTPTQPCM